jgi:predicted 3-demethylubiquinone-9 3-methyltransferase (glyoxalase superfamily)
MATITQRITNCLWFDAEAEQAAQYYTGIFPNSSVGNITRFGKEGFEFHGKAEGSVMTVSFVLDGMELLGLNGGPIFTFNEAMSLIVNCADQEEIDHYWYKLSAGGQESQCGWLKDQFGVSWQIVPARWMEIMRSSDTARVHKAMEKIFTMKKIDLAVIEAAFNS